VSEGIVTLTGTVRSSTERLAAQEAAHRVRDVRDMVTDIVVEPQPADSRRDTEIAQAVRHALDWDARVPHRRILTTVSDGVVTLEGDVDYWSQYEDAERCLRDLIGVRSVATGCPG
jgi:osmotically-inducible protein OsmY